MVRESPPPYHLFEQSNVSSQDRRTLQGNSGNAGLLPKNGTHVPGKAVANWLTATPAELQAKLEKVGLINVTKLKTCKELWDACMKHKTEIKPKTQRLYRLYQTVKWSKIGISHPDGHSFWCRVFQHVTVLYRN